MMHCLQTTNPRLFNNCDLAKGSRISLFLSLIAVSSSLSLSLYIFWGPTRSPNPCGAMHNNIAQCWGGGSDLSHLFVDNHQKVEHRVRVPRYTMIWPSFEMVLKDLPRCFTRSFFQQRHFTQKEVAFFPFKVGTRVWGECIVAVCDGFVWTRPALFNVDVKSKVIAMSANIKFRGKYIYIYLGVHLQRSHCAPFRR